MLDQVGGTKEPLQQVEKISIGAIESSQPIGTQSLDLDKIRQLSSAQLLGEAVVPTLHITTVTTPTMFQTQGPAARPKARGAALYSSCNAKGPLKIEGQKMPHHNEPRQIEQTAFNG
jgi:hypothetical protein